MRIIHYILALVLLLCAVDVSAATYSVSDVPNVQLQDHTRHFSNPDGIVSAATQQRIDSLLMGIRSSTSAEVTVVAVDNIDTDDPEMFATRLFNQWGIGKKDKYNGVLVLVVKDQKYAVIRTGYGAEGVMPDILTGQIRRNVMYPYFRNGDFDSGIYEGVKAISDVLLDPDAAAELKSAQPDNYGGDRSETDFFDIYLIIGAGVLALLLVWLLVMCVKARGLSDYQKYGIVHKHSNIFLVLGVLFIGIPLPAFAIQALLCHYWRNHPRRCPRCHTRMSKLSEDADNKYLSQSQDLEERLDSVDYDVWLCPECGETDIYSFVNQASAYKECPKCHARAMRLSGTRVLQQPTTAREGVGEKVYTCAACHNTHTERYVIPRKNPPPPPPIILGGGGRGGGFGGGSFGGGFGGGLTGGGGSGGRW